MQKLIEVSAAKEFASTFLADPILKMAVNAVLDNAPTTDAVEVVHGRWVWKDGKCFCSACNKQGEPKFVYQDGTVDEYLYCPNCGAKMEGDK